MLKAFLSYSSEDKNLVDKIAEELGRNNIDVDFFSFEEGSKTSEEIYRIINKDKVFIFLISNNSLNSDWVRKELNLFYSLMKKGQNKKILPIIIDKKINYKDERIPIWLKEEYNIQPIFRYKKIANRIKEEIIRLNWNINPKQERIDTLFVGRNELIQRLEERHRESFVPPLCVIASGFYGIGRKSLLKEYLYKVGILEKYKIINLIRLEINESIEDLIIKLVDLGLTETNIKIEKLNQMEEKEKINFLINILKEIENIKELIFIEDNGCIVLPDGELNSWFKKFLNYSSEIKNIVLLIASRFMVKKYQFVDIKNVYGIDVQELSKKETKWLLIELIKIKNLEIDEEELEILLNLLSGHPEQVLYLVKLLELEGFKKVLENSNKIIEFNTNRVAYLLEKYNDNIKAKNLLVLLSNFDFLDYGLLDELLGEEYKELIKDFILEHICYEFGANKEYISLSKPIKDVIVRSDWKLDDLIKEKLKQYTKKTFSNFEIDNENLSQYLYALKEQLINNSEFVNIKNIVPSLVLKAIITLYDQKKKWKDVIILSEKLLYDSYTSLDEQIINQVRKYLCLAYIREYIKTEDSLYAEKFKKEVQNIHDSYHEFLFGFYYRLIGNYESAIEKLKKSLEKNPKFEKAKRELVQIYLLIDEAEKALILAKENYYNSKQNPYLFQAYISCLIKTYYNDKENTKKEIEKIFKEFKNFIVLSNQAKEMYEMAYAKYLALINPEKAKNKIKEVIDEFPISIYPKLTMFDIADKLDDINMLNEAFEIIKKEKKKLPNKKVFEIYEIIYKAKNGDKDNALIKLNSLRNYPSQAKEKLKRRLNLN